MRALLDVNLLIALLDPDHTFHEKAHAWWEKNRRRGWASCPMTENGVVRVLSHPRYSNQLRLSPGELIRLLEAFAAQTDHEFWPDAPSLRDADLFAIDRIHSSRQVTDIYLLGLALSRGGRLATLDQGIPLSAVRGAKPSHLCVLD